MGEKVEKRRNPTIWTGGKRLPQNPTAEAALGKAPMVGRDVGAQRANGECNRNSSVISGRPRPLRPGSRDIFCRPRPPWDSEL